ncbi:MAG: GtrA family protein [Rhodanobacter sp.]
MTRQFFKFLVAGGIAATANFGSRIVLSLWMHYIPAIVVAYLIGMLMAFVLNRLLVFENPSNALHHQMGWFIAVNIAAVLQTLVISLVLADYLLPTIGILRHKDTIAHVFGVAAPVITSYIGHKKFTFPEQIADKADSHDAQA